MTTTINYNDFIIKYTELFSFGLVEYTILGIGFLLVLFLLYVMTGHMLVLLAINGLLLELNLLALSTTYKYIVVLAMVLPFIFVFNYCNLDTKVFKFTVIHFIYALNMYLIPFSSTQVFESYLYVCILLSLLILSIYMSIRSMLIVLSIILVYLICHFGIFVLMAPVDWGVVYKTLDITNKAGILLSLISVYVLMCMSFYIITCFIYIDQYKQLCESINKTPRGVLLLTSLSLFILVFSIKYLYIINVIYMAFFDKLGLIELLPGTKNPHHYWRCNTPLKHFYREYCIKITDDYIKVSKHVDHDSLDSQIGALEEYRKDLSKMLKKHGNIIGEDLAKRITELKKEADDLCTQLKMSEFHHYIAEVKKDEKITAHPLTSKSATLKAGQGEGSVPKELPTGLSKKSYISVVGIPVDSTEDKEAFAKTTGLQNNETVAITQSLSTKSGEDLLKITEGFVSGKKSYYQFRKEFEELKPQIDKKFDAISSSYISVNEELETKK